MSSAPQAKVSHPPTALLSHWQTWIFLSYNHNPVQPSFDVGQETDFGPLNKDIYVLAHLAYFFCQLGFYQINHKTCANPSMVSRHLRAKRPNHGHFLLAYLVEQYKLLNYEADRPCIDLRNLYSLPICPIFLVNCYFPCDNYSIYISVGHNWTNEW